MTPDTEQQPSPSPGCCQPSGQLIARAAHGLERFIATFPQPNDDNGELPTCEGPTGV